MSNEVFKPVPPEESIIKPERFINESTIANQALWLLGMRPPKGNEPIPQLDINQVKEAANNRIDPKHSQKINNASLHERDEFWKDTPDAAERMRIWREKMDAFLAQYKTDPAKKEELEFLQKILRDHEQTPLNKVEITPDVIYSLFIEEGQASLEFFARRIIQKTANNTQEIAQNTELIGNLARIYGENSAKIAKLLTDGIANAQKSTEKFVERVQKYLNDRVFSDVIWEKMEEQNVKWEQTQKTGAIYTNQTSQQPERSKTQEALHPLAENVYGESKKGDKGPNSPNQDDFIINKEEGIFGIFDGVGSYARSHEVATATKEYIGHALAQIDHNFPLNETEQEVGKAFTKINNEIQQKHQYRYDEILEDIKKNIRGEFPANDFDEKYEGPKRRRSISAWIKNRINHTKPDELDKYVLEWVNETVAHEGATTVSIVKLWYGMENGKDQKKAIITNMGDSRVYLLRHNKLESLTTDDTPLYMVVGHAEARRLQDAIGDGTPKNELYKNKKIVLQAVNPIHKLCWDNDKRLQKNYPFNQNGEVEVPYSEIDDYGCASIPEKNLKPNIQSIDVQSGDRLLITSDGIHDSQLRTDIEAILNNPQNKNPARAVQALIKLVNKNVSQKDDMTAIVINIR